MSYNIIRHLDGRSEVVVVYDRIPVILNSWSIAHPNFKYYIINDSSETQKLKIM